VRALDNYISLGSASRVQFLREKLLLRALLSDFSVGFGAKITRSPASRDAEFGNLFRSLITTLAFLRINALRCFLSPNQVVRWLSARSLLMY
jgi:hypothetical protein